MTTLTDKKTNSEQSDLQDAIPKFELEFCFKKDAYMKAYHEDGALWQSQHEKHLSLFHKIFNTLEGRMKIANDAKAIVGVFVDNKESFSNCFDKDEFTIEEMQYLLELSFS